MFAREKELAAPAPSALRTGPSSAIERIRHQVLARNKSKVIESLWLSSPHRIDAPGRTQDGSLTETTRTNMMVGKEKMKERERAPMTCSCGGTS